MDNELPVDTAEVSAATESAPVEKEAIQIPKHRLDEEAKKRQDAESAALAEKARADKAEKEMEALRTQITSLAGNGNLTQNQTEAEMKKFATAYNVPEDFVKSLVEIASKQNQPKQDPLTASMMQEVLFTRELDKLIDDEPELEKALDRSSIRELKKRAFSKEFVGTPLKTIYRDMMFDKKSPPAEDKKTAEQSRPGGRSTESNGEPKLGSMSSDDLRNYFNKIEKSKTKRS